MTIISKYHMAMARPLRCFLCNILSVQQRDIVPLGPLGRKSSSSQKYHKQWNSKIKVCAVVLKISFTFRRATHSRQSANQSFSLRADSA